MDKLSTDSKGYAWLSTMQNKLVLYLHSVKKGDK